MATVKIKASGTPFDGVAFENFSTEETLMEVLSVLKSLKLTGSGDGSTAPVAAKKEASKTGLPEQAASVVKEFEKMAGIFGDVGGVIEEIISAAEILTPELILFVVGLKAVELALSAFHIGLHTISSIVGDLTGTFLAGATQLHEYTNALKDATSEIPIISHFTDLLAAGIEQLDKVNDIMVSLTSVGLDFRGGLSDLIMATGATGLSLEQMAAVTKANLDNFTQFGTAQKGYQKWINVSNVTTTSFLSRLDDMGITMQMYAEELPRILAILGPGAKRRGESDEQLAQAALDLTAQFNAMNKITGKSREQQAADLQRITMDAAWQRKMAMLNPDEEKRYKTLITQLQSMTNGDQIATLFKSRELGIGPLGEDLRVISATVNGLDGQFSKLHNAVERGGDNFQSQIDIASTKIVGDIINSGTNYSNAINAGSLGLSGTAATLATFQSQVMTGNREYIDQQTGLMDTQKKLDDVLQARKDAANVANHELIDFNNEMVKYHDQFTMSVLGPLAHRATPLIQSITSALSDPKVMNDINTGFAQIGAVVEEMGKWVLSNRQQITDTVTGLITFIMGTVKEIVTIVSWMVEHARTMKAVYSVVVAGFEALISTYIVGPITAVVAAIYMIVAPLYELYTGLTKLVDYIDSWFGSPSNAAKSAVSAVKSGTEKAVTFIEHNSLWGNHDNSTLARVLTKDREDDKREAAEKSTEAPVQKPHPGVEKQAVAATQNIDFSELHNKIGMMIEHQKTSNTLLAAHNDYLSSIAKSTKITANN